jgi:hypothetical protein
MKEQKDKYKFWAWADPTVGNYRCLGFSVTQGFKEGLWLGIVQEERGVI